MTAMAQRNSEIAERYALFRQALAVVRQHSPTTMARQFGISEMRVRQIAKQHGPLDLDGGEVFSEEPRRSESPGHPD
jgi:hypothetical protein